jgi:hypothetical protein
MNLPFGIRSPGAAPPPGPSIRMRAAGGNVQRSIAGGVSVASSPPVMTTQSYSAPAAVATSAPVDNPTLPQNLQAPTQAVDDAAAQKRKKLLFAGIGLAALGGLGYWWYTTQK